MVDTPREDVINRVSIPAADDSHAGIRRRFLRGAVWSISGTVLMNAATLAAAVIGARLLGKEKFGYLAAIQSTIFVFQSIAGLGVGLTATRYIAEYRRQHSGALSAVLSTCLTVALVLSLFLAVVMYLAAVPFSIATFNEAASSYLFRLSAPLLLITAYNSAQLGALAGFEDFRCIAVINITRALISIPLAYSLTLHWGLPGYIVSLTVTLLIACVMAAVHIHRKCSLERIALAWLDFRNLDWTLVISHSLPASLSMGLVPPVLWYLNALLIRQPGGAGQLGDVNAVNFWRNLILYVPTIIGQLSVPIMASFNRTSTDGRWTVLRWNMLATLLVSIGSGVPIILLAPWVMSIYGHGFVSAAPLLRITIVVGILMAIGNVVGNSIVSSGSMWIGTWLNALWAIETLAFSTYFIPKSGAYGMSIALLCAYTIHTLTVGIYLYRVLKGSARPVPLECTQ